MKRFGWLLPIFIMITLCVSGCDAGVTGAQGEDPFAFLRGPITLEGILAVGEKEYGIVLQSPDGTNGKVTFTCPKSMEGYAFEKAQDGYFVSYGDLRVPLRQSTLPGGAGSLLQLLTLRLPMPEQTTEKANGMEMSVYTFSLAENGGKIKLYLKKTDQSPLRIEFMSDVLDAVFHIQKAEY
ncbi:MAG: hypothetical protein E7599_00110 [Ruminococcaceae bacterium]|nr:hypothetical protein [Oscillospiraceae bacterium]